MDLIYRAAQGSGQGVLATFRCVGEGHWTTAPLTAKIVVDESNKARTLCFVGDLHREQCVVLELLTQHLVLTKWDHQASKVKVKVDPKSFAYPMEVSADVLRREQLAVQARDAAGVSEFRVTGSIRTAWYEAQRRDPSLAAALKKPEAPMVLGADGLLERDVTCTALCRFLNVARCFLSSVVSSATGLAV